MELKIDSYQLPAALSFNYEELKTDLLAKVAKYENLVYTDEQISEAKADKANLNKLKKALNDERIRQEREYMKPFMDFKTKINEIIEIIDQPVQIIDRQVQEFEDQRKQKKMAEIGAYFNSCERPEWLNFKQIFVDKWLNASVSMKQIKLAIDEKLGQIKLEMKTLEALHEFAFEAAECYKKTLNISMAIDEGKRLAEIQKRKVEAEEQRKQREAEEKARQEAAAQQQPTPVEAVQPVAQQQAEAPAGQWIAFEAFLTVEQAKDLGAFFRDHGIKYRSIH